MLGYLVVALGQTIASGLIGGALTLMAATAAGGWDEVQLRW